MIQLQSEIRKRAPLICWKLQELLAVSRNHVTSNCATSGIWISSLHIT